MQWDLKVATGLFYFTEKPVNGSISLKNTSKYYALLLLLFKSILSAPYQIWMYGYLRYRCFRFKFIMHHMTHIYSCSTWTLTVYHLPPPTLSLIPQSLFWWTVPPLSNSWKSLLPWHLHLHRPHHLTPKAYSLPLVLGNRPICPVSDRVSPFR